MSLENGGNMFDYCFNIFKRYKEDNTIFTKALQILQYFQSRKDYPFCLEELDRVFESIVGDSLSEIADFSGKYIEFEGIYWDVHETQMEEAEKIVDDSEEGSRLAKCFENEFRAFCITIKPVIAEVFMMENHPMKLKQLTHQQLFGEDGYSIRIIRNDNEKLDLIVKENDIEFLIDSLQKIVGENN